MNFILMYIFMQERGSGIVRGETVCYMCVSVGYAV